MQTKTIIRTLATAGLLALSSLGQAQTSDRAYVVDGRNEVARSGYGLCWHTGSWTPASAAADPAGCACDRELLPREKCETAAAPKPVPAAAAAAAPKKCDFAYVQKDDQTFAFNQSRLMPGATRKLDQEVFARLASCASISAIVVTGHTDRLGSQQYNQKLSEKRAAAIKDYLVHKGVPADAIETVGAGKTQPVPGVKCDDKLPRKQLVACLAPHRRTVIEVRGPAK